MLIEAINEKLLRAIGVGVALADLRDLSLRFRNDTFIEWFGDAEGSLAELFPALDIEALVAAIRTEGRFQSEVSFKLRRRTMTLSLDVNPALDTESHIAVMVFQNISRIKELEAMIDSYSMMVDRNMQALKREKEQVEKLLLNLMPRAAYEEYKTFGVVEPRLFEPVSVLSLRFTGFNDLVRSCEPAVIVSELNDLYSAFDKIGEQFQCERIRTHGGTYMAVAGVPDVLSDPAQAIAGAAIRFLRYLTQRNRSHPIQWQAEIGLATGSVVGSVVGHQRYIYDVFGPAVEAAINLRRRAGTMRISADRATVEEIADAFSTEPIAGPDGAGEAFAITDWAASTTGEA